MQQALSDYAEAFRLEPDNAEAAFKLASAYESVQELERAIAAYTQVLQLDPHNSQARLRRASCRNMLGDYAGANCTSPATPAAVNMQQTSCRG